MNDLKISKELLSEVLKIPLEAISKIYFDKTNLLVKKSNNRIEEHNIYEFIFKCKDWAKKLEYIIFSSPTQKIEYTAVVQSFDINKIYFGQNQFYALTEVEAIIKASEWIIKERKFI